MRKLGIYIHVPFCKSKCKYCDFYSIPCHDKEDEYVKRLIEEIRYYSEIYGKRTVDTVYFGGGTPTSLKTGRLNSVFNEITRCFDVEKNAEITVEANPDTVNADKVSSLQEFATRISVGVQSMDDYVLRFAGRIHDVKSAKQALEMLIGKFDVSADLMLGLPYSTVKKSVDSAREILSMGVGHLSCYGLKIEPDTPFAALDRSIFPDDDKLTDEYDAILEECKRFGLDMYEVSNFAKPGLECRHNMRYWQREDYLGFGVSAHSFIDKTRFYNPSDISGYVENDFVSFRKTEEVVNDVSAIDETIMLALRTKKGIDTNKFLGEFGINFFEKFKDKINKLLPYLDIKDENISIKEKYFYAMNSIIVEFLD